MKNTIYMKLMLGVLTKVSLFLLMLFGTLGANAQTTTLNTTAVSGWSNNNGSGTVTFNLENTNAYGILITEIEGVSGTAGATTCDIWYKTTPISGAPGVISVANGWTLGATGTFTAVANTSSLTTQVMLTGISVLIPSGVTYGIAVSAYSGTSGRQRYHTMVSPNIPLTTVSDGGVNLTMGTNISYGGGVPNGTAPTNSPRGWIGKLSFVPDAPCVFPPTGGNATTTNATPCSGQNFTLNLTGNSGGSGQTYQWQYSTTSTGPWTNIGGLLTSPAFTTSSTVPYYYQCELTCSANTGYSAPVFVNVPTPFSGGTYTINNTLPTGGTNFNSFADAVSAISCGISGPVVFNVATGTGPYNEQVTIPSTVGTNATNTVTFNGNGETLTYLANATLPHTFGLDGADYITVNDLNIEGTDPTYAIVCHLYNDADNNAFNNCTFTAPLNSTGTFTIPFSISGSATTGASSGNCGEDNIVTGCTAIGGYYSMYFYGNSGALSTGNKAINCSAKDFYLYGIYALYQDGWEVRGCTVERPTRTTLSTFYGIYSSTGTVGSIIHKNIVRDPFAMSTTSTSSAYCIYVGTDGTLGNEHKVINNLVYNINSNGLIAGIYESGADYIQTYHNTIVFDDAVNTAGTTYGIYNTGTVGNKDIQNNIIVITRAGTGTKYGYYFTSVAPVSNYNDVYINAPSGNFGYFVSTTYADLPTWQSATSQDANSVSIDPQFLAPTIFIPTNPAVNDLGNAAVGVLEDIDGNPRSLVNPDMGAYEFSISGCTNPPTPGTVSSTSTNVCNGELFTLSLSGGTFGVGQTYQWESSPDNIVWTPIVGADQPSYSATQAYTTYYRCAVTCGVTVNSAELQIISTVAPLAGLYTINQTLPTGGTNYNSFNDLLLDLNCGGVSAPVVIDVVSGTGPYNEQVSFGAIGGVDATNTITINGNGNLLTYAASLSTAPSTLELNGTDYLIINDLNVEGTGATYAFACHLWNNADNNTFNNCIFTVPIANTGTANSPFSCSASATSTTTTGASGINNVLTGCSTIGGYYNCVFAGNSTLLATGNKIISHSAQDFYLYGIYMLYQDGIEVSGCDVSRPTRTTVSTTYAIYASSGCVGSLIEKNKVHNLFDQALTSTSTTYCIYVLSDGTLGNENKVFNNVVYNINNGGGTQAGLYLSGADYVQAYHNTISLDDAAATAGTVYGIYSTGTVGNIDIKNNIITVGRGGTGTKYGLYYTNNTQASDYNDVYVSSTTGTNYFGYNAGTTYADLTAWQATTYDANSISVDPVYVDMVLGNYAPATVAVDNLGTPLTAVVDDINGDPRSATTPDMGAYEFSVPTDDLAITALIDPTVGTGCKTTNETITVELKNYGLNPIDFSLAPTNITVNVGGPIPNVIFETLTFGTIPVGGTLNVTLTTTTDMTLPGTYTFDASVLYLLDANSSNDVLPTQTVVLPNLVAGAIVSSVNSICVSESPTFTLTGQDGVGNIQWMESTVSATGPWTNVGTNSTTYTPTAPYTQAMWVTAEVSCNTSTASANVIDLPYFNPTIASTMPGTICGPGVVSLSATAASPTASVEWFDAPTGGSPLFVGGIYTPSVASTTTFYAAASEGGGGGNAKPILITELDPGGPDALEIQNVSPNAVNVTGWKVAISNSYTDFTSVNTIVQTLSGTMNPGDKISWTDATGTNYWGNNILWNPGAYPSFTGWALILDDLDNLVDFVPMNWPASVISTTSITIGTATVNPGSIWSGDGYDITSVPTGSSVSRVGNSDNNNSTDFTTLTTSLDVNNTGIVLPFTGFGCSGVRVPVLATVNTPPTVSITASSSTLCLGESTTLSVTSSNDPDYTYTWEPGTLSGASQTVSPTESTTYTLTAIDNTTGTYAGCTNIDNVTITVNPVPIITATATPASIPCGDPTTLDVSQNFEYVSGTGAIAQSTTGQTPYSHFYEGQRTQYLILASDLAAQNIAAGNITALSFNVTAKNSGPNAYNVDGDYKSYTINMANTTATDLSAADATGTFNTVYGPTNYTTALGVNTHTFTTPFVWDGVSNVVVQVCFENDPTAGGTAYTSNDEVAASTTSYTSVRGYYQDNGTTCTSGGTLTTASTLPNITLSSPDINTYVWEPGTLSGSTHTVMPTANTDYTVTATNSFSCTTEQVVSVTVAPCTATLNITAFIQGFYAGASTMQAALVNQGVSVNPTDCDSVTVELHDATSPYAVAHSFTGVLQTDGTLACIFPPASVGNSYYIVMNHRNSVQTWSAAPVAISLTGSYQFSTAATQAYGSNEVDAFSDGVYSMYNGDVNQDGFIDIFDFLDWDVDNQNFASGYYATDLNGDGFIDIFDFLVWDPNNQSFIGLITP